MTCVVDVLETEPDGDQIRFDDAFDLLLTNGLLICGTLRSDDVSTKFERVPEVST